MARKFQLFFLFGLIVVVALSLAAFVSSEKGTLAQGGMGMDTATPALQETPTPTWVMGPYGYGDINGGMMGGGMMGGGMMGGGMTASGTLDATSYSMGSCPMMTGMAGYTDSSATGMNVVPANMAVYNRIPYWQNPWILLGWVLLAVVVCALIAGIVLGIVWLARRVGRRSIP